MYIQHLNPTHESQLVAILNHITAMPVIEAGPLMPIQANHVYIIPPNQEMEVVDGALILMPRRAVAHMPIDRFFISLSKQQKAGAVAILLSGMA